MNTLSLFPRNTAHPPLVGKTARTCTSITDLFIGQTVPGQSRKTSGGAGGSHAPSRDVKCVPPKAHYFLALSSPQDESVRLADKRMLDPPWRMKSVRSL